MHEHKYNLTGISCFFLLVITNLINKNNWVTLAYLHIYIKKTSNILIIFPFYIRVTEKKKKKKRQKMEMSSSINYLINIVLWSDNFLIQLYIQQTH